MIHSLNLRDRSASDISYKVSNFPDGQSDITINLSHEITEDSEVEIVSYFRNFKDLEIFVCATAALRRLGISKVSLNIPYLLGARSDREFVAGGTSYLVDIIAPILNAKNYKKVYCIDPHSDVAAACIHNLVAHDSHRLVEQAIQTIAPRTPLTIISPDGGSLKKIYKIVEKISGPLATYPVLVCSKSRGTDGKLSKTEVPVTDLTVKEYLIIDDICDGGRTFITLANELRRKHGEGDSQIRIHLVVTHGIFSNGFSQILEVIDTIHFSDSYSKFDPSQHFELMSGPVFQYPYTSL